MHEELHSLPLELFLCLCMCTCTPRHTFGGQRGVGLFPPCGFEEIEFRLGGQGLLLSCLPGPVLAVLRLAYFRIHPHFRVSPGGACFRKLTSISPCPDGVLFILSIHRHWAGPVFFPEPSELSHHYDVSTNEGHHLLT